MVAGARGVNVEQLARAQREAEARADWPTALHHAQALAGRLPASAGAQYNVGVLHLQCGSPPALAIAAFERALARDATLVPAWVAWGQACLAQGDPQAAARRFQQACRLAPDEPGNWLQFGAASLQAWDGASARVAFERLRTLAPDDPDTWRGLSEAGEQCGDFAQARRARERELALRPDDVEPWLQAALMSSRMGEDAPARDAVARALQLAPDCLLARWLDLQLLPRVHADASAQRQWRAHWLERLSALEAIDPAACAPADLVEAINAVPNFFLHYHGGALREEQRRHGALLTRWLRRALPSPQARTRARREGRLRVGYASAHLHEHTIARLFGGWLSGLDRDRFVIVACYLGMRPDEARVRLGRVADEIAGPWMDVDASVRGLCALDLDVLVWLDIGMDGTTQVLSGLRFAPLQCVAWGHPVTTGLEAIDVFLSAASMEPDGACANYLERLVPLPGIGIDYPMPIEAAARVRRARHPGDAATLVCAQSVYKITPLHYDLFARIAAALPDARLEFCPHPTQAARDDLARCMRPAFLARGVDFDRRVTMHGALDREGFFDLLARADVLLDTVDWSGGNTTLEALALDLPVVTLPGDTMRARHTFGMLSVLDLTGDLAVADLDAYVERVVRLVRDPAFHARMVEAIRARKSRLFGDATPVRALEDFLWRECGRTGPP